MVYVPFYSFVFFHVTVIQLNGSDLVGLHLLSTTDKFHTGDLQQLLRINIPLLLDITESEMDFQIKYFPNIRNGTFNIS